MIKILSFKTRRSELDFGAFRSHYEGAHVPLGLSFIDHFRWRRYVRNYVVRCVRGSVGFDCLTEFWVASRADQEATAAFVGSADFGILDRDDRSFLDVTRRLSFEVEERILVAPTSKSKSKPCARVSMFIDRPRSMSASVFAGEIGAQAAEFASRPWDAGSGVSLDLRSGARSEDRGVHAVLSLWGESTDAVQDFDWPPLGAAAPIVVLESVETPAELLLPQGDFR